MPDRAEELVAAREANRPGVARGPDDVCVVVLLLTLRSVQRQTLQEAARWSKPFQQAIADDLQTCTSQAPGSPPRRAGKPIGPRGRSGRQPRVLRKVGRHRRTDTRIVDGRTVSCAKVAANCSSISLAAKVLAHKAAMVADFSSVPVTTLPPTAGPTRTTDSASRRSIGNHSLHSLCEEPPFFRARRPPFSATAAMLPKARSPVSHKQGAPSPWSSASQSPSSSEPGTSLRNPPGCEAARQAHQHRSLISFRGATVPASSQFSNRWTTRPEPPLPRTRSCSPKSLRIHKARRPGICAKPP